MLVAEEELPYGLELSDGVLSGTPLASAARRPYVILGAEEHIVHRLEQACKHLLSKFKFKSIYIVYVLSLPVVHYHGIMVSE